MAIGIVSTYNNPTGSDSINKLHQKKAVSVKMSKVRTSLPNSYTSALEDPPTIYVSDNRSDTTFASSDGSLTETNEELYNFELSSLIEECRQKTVDSRSSLPSLPRPCESMHTSQKISPKSNGTFRYTDSIGLNTATLKAYSSQRSCRSYRPSAPQLSAVMEEIENLDLEENRNHQTQRDLCKNITLGISIFFNVILLAAIALLVGYYIYELQPKEIYNEEMISKMNSTIQVLSKSIEGYLAAQKDQLDAARNLTLKARV